MTRNIDDFLDPIEHAAIDHTGIPGVGGGGGVDAQSNGAAVVGPQPRLNFVDGTNVTMSVVENVPRTAWTSRSMRPAVAGSRRSRAQPMPSWLPSTATD